MHGFTDKKRPLVAEVIADALDAEALIIAAPTYEAGLYPYLRLVIELVCEKAAAAKRLYILSTYGWGGAAVKRIRGIMEGCGFETVAFIEAKSVLESQSPVGEAAKMADAITGAR
jgi:flavorubredoxin